MSFPDCVESVLMTECYVPFHSLRSNGIRQEGCSALTAALQQCKQLQVLRWVLNDLLTVILAPQLITYMHIRIVLTSCMWNTEATEQWLLLSVPDTYPLYVAHSKWRPDISLCRITLIWFIDQESHSEIVFSIHRQWTSGPVSYLFWFIHKCLITQMSAWHLIT